MALLPAVAACNSIVGFGELQKVTVQEQDDDDDDSTVPGRSDGGSGNGSGDSGPAIDGSPSGPKCDPSKPFSPPAALAGPVNSASFEVAPSLMNNELMIVFQRTVGPEGGSLMLATRSSIDAPFGEPKELTALAQGLVGVQQPTMTADGLLLFFIGVSGSNGRLFTASRVSPAGEFTNRRAADELDTNGSESFPALTPNGEELWFSSQPGVDVDRRFFRSVRDSIGDYGTPSRVTELAAKAEAGVAFSADGLTVFFGSERAGGAGEVDIWTAKRPALGAPFGAASVVSELNSAVSDYPGWLSADGCRLYFGSDRSGGGDLFVATRPP